MKTLSALMKTIGLFVAGGWAISTNNAGPTWMWFGVILLVGSWYVHEYHYSRLTKRALDADCSHAYTHGEQPKDYVYCPWCGGKNHQRQ